MKKIPYTIMIMLILVTSLKAAEKKDCSELKKFSKKYLACKTENLKSGVENKLSGTNNPLKGVIEYQKKAWSKKLNK